MMERSSTDLWLSLLVTITLFGWCSCFQCYEYTVRNKVSPAMEDLRKQVTCEGLSRPMCIKVITKNSMKGLAEETEKAFTTEGRCALYDDECMPSQANKCFDEPPRNLFGIIQKTRKCCSTKELSNSARSSLISSTALPTIIVAFASAVYLLTNPSIC